MTTHSLKTWPEFFQKMLDGDKTFELRKNDRNFAVGDTLLLREFDPWPSPAYYTGRELSVRVTYVMRDGHFGLEPGFVCLGIEKISPRAATFSPVCQALLHDDCP